MNSITQKIQDVYVLYNLCDKNISETIKERVRKINEFEKFK